MYKNCLHLNNYYLILLNIRRPYKEEQLGIDWDPWFQERLRKITKTNHEVKCIFKCTSLIMTIDQ